MNMAEEIKNALCKLETTFTKEEEKELQSQNELKLVLKLAAIKRIKYKDLDIEFGTFIDTNTSTGKKELALYEALVSLYIYIIGNQSTVANTCTAIYPTWNILISFIQLYFVFKFSNILYLF